MAFHQSIVFWRGAPLMQLFPEILGRCLSFLTMPERRSFTKTCKDYLVWQKRIFTLHRVPNPTFPHSPVLQELYNCRTLYNKLWSPVATFTIHGLLQLVTRYVYARMMTPAILETFIEAGLRHDNFPHYVTRTYTLPELLDLFEAFWESDPCFAQTEKCSRWFLMMVEGVVHTTGAINMSHKLKKYMDQSDALYDAAQEYLLYNPVIGTLHADWVKHELLG